MKRLLFSFLFVLTAIAGWAQEPTTFTVGNFKYTVTDDENHYVSIAKADEATFNSALVIPSSVVYETVTYTVTSVGASGFYETGITSVTIPASVLSVGSQAFYDCDGLTAITIEDSETALEWNGTDYHPLNEVHANYTLYLGRNLTTEGNQCFFPGATSVMIGDRVTAVNPYLFDGANKLASVTMGSGVTTIGDYAFQNTGTDESVTAQSIALGANVITIGDYAFSGCNKLTTLALGRKLTAIPENMLFSCSALTSITIPASVQSVGAHAFYDCDGLTAITIEDSETALEWNGTDYHPLNQVNSNYTLYLGRDLTTEGNQCFFPGATSVEIGDQMTTVNPYLFDGANKLASVTMGSGVTTIGDYAFQNTGTDESVTAQSIALGANVITIGDYAFSGCNKLTTLALGRKLTAIPENMLFSCSALTSITIPASVQSVGAHAFYDCDGLTSITIEDSETALEWNGTDYHPLNEVHANYTLYLGRNLTTEGNQCFFPGATSVMIGDRVTAVNPYLFDGANKLASVTMGSGVTTIGDYAFQNTGTDESVTAQSIALGANVITIGDYAFSGCNKLTTLALGRKLTAIPENMLFSCSALTSITIPASVQSVGAHAFYDCDGLTTITIEDSGTALEWNGTDYHPLNEVNSNYTLYLGRDLTTEGNQCFFPGATSVEFGPQVTAIPNNLFSGAELSSVKVPWLTPIAINENVFASGAYSSATLFVPAGTKEAYAAASVWKDFTNVDHWSTLVTLTASTHGSIVTAEATASNSTEQYRQPKNDDIVYTLTADEGYELTALTDNDAAVSPLPTLGEEQTRANTEGEEFVTLNASFTPITYTLTYTLNGGTATNPATYTIETTTFTLNNPTKAGYDFAGWKLNGVGEAMMTVTIAQGSTGHLAYTATWTPTVYNIVYTMDGGTATPANPTTYTIETETFTLTNPTKTGYTFKGWKLNGEGDAMREVTIAQGSTGHLAYTATWQVNKYTITFDSNGGSAVDPITLDYGSTVTAPDEPTKSGYNFGGWTPALPETMPAENMTVTAIWTINTYTVSITGAGVTADKMNPEYGDDVVITIATDEDRTLNTLTVNGVDVTASVVDGQYTIENVTGNVTVVATFNSTKEFITLAQGVGTFSCSQDLNFTGSELKAYIAAGYNKSTNVTLLVRVYDVPAGTGLYLKGGAGVTYKIPYSTSQAYYVNMLKANLTAGSIDKTDGDMSNFLLNKVDGEYGFFAPSETATLGAQKAYLQLPTSFVPASARAISLAFEDDETTNINDFEMFTNSNDRLYNLKGQRIEKAGRGIYIKNGKKVVIK